MFMDKGLPHWEYSQLDNNAQRRASFVTCSTRCSIHAAIFISPLSRLHVRSALVEKMHLDLGLTLPLQVQQSAGEQCPE